MKQALIEIARKTNIADVRTLESFFDQNGDKGQRLDTALLGSGVLSEDQILRLFGEYLGLDFMEQIKPSDVPSEFVAKIPATYAQHHSLVAVKTEDSLMTIATSKPLSVYAMDNAAKLLGWSVKPVLATQAVINTAINTAYEQRVTVLEDVAGEVNANNIEGLIGEMANSEDLLDVVNRPPVIRLVNDILFRALQLRASDVHIHPYEQKILIRYRIDGLMYDMLTLDYRILPVVVSRIKVMAGMDIAERRMAQDGRCSVRIGPREIDLRVSTVPTAYGERTVLRILDKSTGIYTLENLGLSQRDFKRIDYVLDRTHGVFFVTGPTGSGKTTTLYSFLKRIDATEKNIMTVEDPIEYQLDAISQIQVASKKGMTFVTALRHILRQDPDVIMVGEVRDQETARMVIQSSLTGHLVFSTLHTNDAAGAITRMLDLGVEPYLVASSVAGVLAQRLVRKLCPECKEIVKAESEQMRDLGLGYAAFEHIYRNVGCEKCFNTGYFGRTGIYELMVVDDDIRQCIYQRKTAGAIKKAAVDSGMTTLRMDGLEKVEKGATSLEEVLRVAHTDEY
ncbi:MAG: type II secretion system ATPase GspE [Sedimentisphaerales bacterium]|nr:type II secretion system ATPase GspE [Sedimentisphaerales bacterium]